MGEKTKKKNKLSSESSLDLPKFKFVLSLCPPLISSVSWIVSARTSPGIPGRRRPCGDGKVASSIHGKTRFPWEVLCHRALWQPYELIGTGVTCSADLGSLSSAFILFSSLHSRQLFSIFYTPSSLLDTYLSHCGTTLCVCFCHHC